MFAVRGDPPDLFSMAYWLLDDRLELALFCEQELRGEVKVSMKNGDEIKSISLEAMKKRAKSLLKACRQGDGVAVDFIRRYHSAYHDEESLDSLKLQEVQYALACKNGYKNWSEFQLGICDQANSVRRLERVLLFTNGGHAEQQIRNAGKQAEIVAWNDVLHEGPVSKTSTLLTQSQERVAHLASLGWVTEATGKKTFRERDQFLLDANLFSRIELWFEHDLYDQLQLIQILAELGKCHELRGKVWLNQFDDYIGSLEQTRLQQKLDGAILVGESEFLEARVAWNAFRDSNPFALQKLLKQDLKLPYLNSALRRVCEEYPDVNSGLPRSSRQILEAVAAGIVKPVELFRENQKREEAIYLGDSSFWVLLNRLTLGRKSLLRTNTGTPFELPKNGAYSLSFRRQELGLKVLGGDESWLSCKPDAFHLGGVRIFSEPYWSFDVRTSDFVT